MHGAHILPKPAHFGYMAANCCREPAFFPPEAPSGTHEAKKLPRIAAREHATAKYCHGSPPGNAPRRYLAKAGSPGTHRGGILPLSDAGERISRAFCHRQAPENAPRRYFGIATKLGNTQRRHVATARRRRRRPKRRAALPARGSGAEPLEVDDAQIRSAIYAGGAANCASDCGLWVVGAICARGSGLESLVAYGLRRATLSVRPCACASVHPLARASMRLCEEWGFRPLGA